MKNLLRILVLSLTLLPLQMARPQGLSSSGTDYWMAFMPNGVSSLGMIVQLNLFIATGTANKVSVTSGGSTKSMTMGANTIWDLSLDNTAITSQTETPTANAVHVTSTNPITVYGYSVWTCSGCLGGSPDGFLALPITSYGTKYYSVNFPDANFGSSVSRGEFVVVAPYDNTNVTITTPCDTRGGHSASTPWTVSLKRGETYLVQSPGTQLGSNDLTGSLITSDKPIAVLTGHEISSVPVGQNSADHFLEMVPSADRWGTQYFDMPMAGRTGCGDYIRVISAEDGNTITYNGLGPFILNAGEYADRELVTDPEVYTSTNHKKFMVAQYSYSQGFNGDPGVADPFMILFTPQEQFEKEMIFRTPTPAKSGAFFNYVTFITLYDSIKKITINGQGIGAYQTVGLQKFLNTDPVMGALRVKLPGVRNYIAQGPTPFGAYQYGFASYEGYGWPTGMAQRLITPDTLPPLSRILDSACGTFHLRFFEPRTKALGFSFDDTRIAYLALITDVGDSRWSIPSFNYVFTPDPNFTVGDSVTNGTLTVTDLTKDAYAAIFAVDRAGNDTVYEYHYYAPKIAFNPLPTYDFGNILVDHDTCMRVTLTNTQNAGDFAADSARIQGGATGGSFSVTPTALHNVPAHDSVVFTVCYHASDTGHLSLDSLTVFSACVPYPMQLRGIGITPLIDAADLDFGEVDSGKTKCMPLSIRNSGHAPLTITRQDLLATDPNFSVDPAQKFPIVIPAGQRIFIQYCFHPQTNGTFSAHIDFLNENPSRFQHSIKDTSLLKGFALPAGAKLTSYQKTFSIGCSDTVLFDTLFDNLPKSIEIDSVALGGPDAKYFQIVSSMPGFPYVLDSTNAIPFRIQYHPTMNGLDLTPHSVTLTAFPGPGYVPPQLTIYAQLTTPIVKLSSPAVSLGLGLAGQTLTNTFTISNTGNLPLDVNSYNLGGADAASFTLSPAPPYTIAAGASQVVTVTMTGAQARKYAASVSILGTCNSDAATLAAEIESVGDQVQGTVHPKTYVGGCRSDQQAATFTNLNSATPIIVQNVVVAAANGWNDVNDFALASPFTSQTLAPSGVVSVPIVFVPMATGVRNAALIFSLSETLPSGTDSTWTETVQLQGAGVTVARASAVGSVTVPPLYHQIAASTVDLPIVINSPIDANAPDNGTLEAYGYTFQLTWKQDAFQYQTTTPPTVIVTDSSFDKTTGLETRTFRYFSSTPLAGTASLATVTAQVMLNRDNTTPITLSKVTWLGQDQKPLCYVSDTSTSASFQYDPSCGSVELQQYLTTGTVALSIGSIQPNPVEHSATIGFSANTSGLVSVTVYDVMGNPVRRLVDRAAMKPGVYSVQLPGDGLASGVYFCRITDGASTVTKRFEKIN